MTTHPVIQKQDIACHSVLIYNLFVKKHIVHPVWVLVILASAALIGEITVRILSFPGGFQILADVLLLIWGIMMFFGGIFSILSYFFENRWKGFNGLIWTYKNIMPIGGKVNAIIIGIIGIAIGIVSMIKAFSSGYLLAAFFLSSINLDSLSISPGLVLYRMSTKDDAAEPAEISRIPCITSSETCLTKSSLDMEGA